MFVHIVIGGAQQGKTPFIKNYSEGSNLLVFDVQDEYGSRVKYEGQKALSLSLNNKLSRSRVIDIDPDNFIAICGRKRNTICVFEEATMFFQGITTAPMRKLVFSKAHTRNIYILVFHSINSVPPRLMESCDYVILFKTSDEERTVENKYPRLLVPYKKLQGGKSGEHIKIKMI